MHKMRFFLIRAVGLALMFSSSAASIGPTSLSSQAALERTIHSQADTSMLFLPMMITGSLQAQRPQSFELIDQALADGKIDAETALIYKVFAQFSDARLPIEYIGSGTGRAGDLIMEQVVMQAESLSLEAIRVLTPFFVPPDYPGSWYQFPHTNGSQIQADVAGWSSVLSANGKVQISWPTGDVEGARQAGVVKAAMDAKIWDLLTTLMGKEPEPDTTSGGALRIYLWNSYVENNGTVVPFDANTLGITVGTSCDQTAVVIYMPIGLPDGSENSAGLIQYVTHEFMHAIQFGMEIRSCGDYSWLKEATATWAEDYVYKDANSEWETADKFLDHASLRLNATGGMHEYGAYLFPYFLTHQFGDNTLIRKMWENAAAQDNSYMAVQLALPEGMESEVYWPLFLSALWNKAPFAEFYKSNDKLLETVKPDNATPIQVSAAGHEFVYELTGNLPTGAARYYHISFPDSSVRSFTILDGLGYKLQKGQSDEVYTVEGDQTYTWEELTPYVAQGATVMALIKVEGQDWRPVVIPNNPHTYCMDLQAKIEDLVIVQSNADFENPNRVMTPAGLPTTIFASNMPCWKVTGTSKITIFNAGVTKTTSASNIVYSDVFEISDPYVSIPWIFPADTLFLKSATVNWSISGNNGSCSYSGSGTFEVHEHPGSGSDSITLFNGILSGSPTYRGYIGAGFPDEGTKVTYTVQCDDDPPFDETEDAWAFLVIPLYHDRANTKVSGDGNALSGSYKKTETWGDWVEYEWNLTGQHK